MPNGKGFMSMCCGEMGAAESDNKGMCVRWRFTNAHQLANTVMRVVRQI